MQELNEDEGEYEGEGEDKYEGEDDINEDEDKYEDDEDNEDKDEGEDEKEIATYQHKTVIPSYFTPDLHIPTKEEIQLKIQKQNKEREEREKKMLEELKEREKQIYEYDKRRAKQIKESMRKFENGEPLFEDWLVNLNNIIIIPKIKMSDKYMEMNLSQNYKQNNFCMEP